MLPENVEGESQPNKSGSDEFQHSFHDRLLIRSQDYGSARKRAKLAKLVDRGDWAGWVIGVREILADCAIFAGGAAFGAGVIRVRRDESLTGLGGATIAIGLGIIAVTILSRLWVRSRFRHAAQAARS